MKIIVESLTLAVIQLVCSLIALIICLWNYPFRIFYKSINNWTRLQCYQLGMISSLVLLQVAESVEVSIHLHKLFDESGKTLDLRGQGQILNPVAKYLVVFLFWMSGMNLVCFVGTKYKTMTLPDMSQYDVMNQNTTRLSQQTRHHTSWLNGIYGVTGVLGLWFATSYVLTDTIPEDILFTSRVASTVCFCCLLIIFAGTIEFAVFFTIFHGLDFATSPTAIKDHSPSQRPMAGFNITKGRKASFSSARLRHYKSVLRLVSLQVKLKVLVFMTLLITISNIALGLYLWTELHDRSTTLNHYSCIALSMATIVINFVQFLIGMFHKALNDIHKAFKKPASNTDDTSSATPSEFKSISLSPSGLIMSNPLRQPLRLITNDEYDMGVMNAITQTEADQDKDLI